MNFTLPRSYSLKTAHRDKQCWCEKGMPLLQLEIFWGVNKLQNGYKYEAFKITKSITKFWLQLRKQINCTQKLFMQHTSSFTKYTPVKTLLYRKLIQPKIHGWQSVPTPNFHPTIPMQSLPILVLLIYKFVTVSEELFKLKCKVNAITLSIRLNKCIR